MLNNFETTMIKLNNVCEQLTETIASLKMVSDDYMQTYIQNVELTRLSNEYNDALHRQANKLKSLGQTVHDLELKLMERNREMKLPPNIKEHRDENGKTTLIVDVPVQNELKGIEKRWFDVNERLPETNEEVLVWYEFFVYEDCTKPSHTYGIAYYDVKYRRWIDKTGTRREVLYWTPLSKPPVNKE